MYSTLKSCTNAHYVIYPYRRKFILWKFHVSEEDFSIGERHMSLVIPIHTFPSHFNSLLQGKFSQVSLKTTVGLTAMREIIGSFESTSGFYTELTK